MESKNNLQQSSEIILARNLSSGYKNHIVWQNASFEVSRGEFVGILGPNGAGKTTLFKMLLGLQDPIAGELKIFGKEPMRGNPRIGYIPQRRPVDSEMKIEAIEIVRLGLMQNYWSCFSTESSSKQIEKSMQALKDCGCGKFGASLAWHALRRRTAKSVFGAGSCRRSGDSFA